MFEIWDPRLCWVFIIPVFAKNKIHGCQADLKTQLVFAGCAAESTRLWINLFQLNQTCKVPRGFFGMLLVQKNNRKTQIYGARNKSEHKYGFKRIPPFIMSPNTRCCHSARGESVNSDCRKRLCGRPSEAAHTLRSGSEFLRFSPNFTVRVNCFWLKWVLTLYLWKKARQLRLSGSAIDSWQ